MTPADLRARAEGALASASAPTWVQRAAWTVAVLGVLAMFGVAGASPKDPYLAGSRVAGFDEAALAVVDPAGRALAARCALLATTDAQHERGLMGRTDLAGYAAMAFVFRGDVGVRFYNRNVPIALSVAWFDASGRWVGSADMAPCPDQAGCPEVGSPTSYRTAIEVPKGQLASLGLAQGSQLTVTPGCR